MRTVLSALLGLAAVLLLLGGVTATAVQRTVVDPDGFVALTAPLASDDGMRDRLAGTVATEATNRFDLQGPAADAVGEAIDKVSTALTEDPAFPGAWETSMRRSHDRTMATLTDAARTDVLQVDIQPLVSLLVDKAAGSLGITAMASPVGDDPIVLDVGQSAQARAAAIVVQAAGYAPAALAGAAVAAVLALLLARRRTTTLAWLGIGVLAGTGLLALAGVLLRAAVAGGQRAPGLTEYLRYRVVDAASAAGVPWVVGLAIWGAVLLAAGAVGRLVVGRPGAGSAQR
ncbi:hypothetical protein GCM10011512_17740 [Tersicoccus solisilvae]|uniref:Integral membrane protein n=1 Tax=Tersicoccus solisilvae TaxID=1882339 RepID=A0ABQ1PB36_9MICC|nr:hypothetical protein [Tersicoccus solisilvae]GGC91150.1 hypothetical protein GCM10011512_17740 [Tersicoccus solisilvae]